MESRGRGAAFEEKVEMLLRRLEEGFPKRVIVQKHPRIKLHDGREVIPDFDFQFQVPWETSCYLIECQDRQRNTPTIAHKLRYLKSLSPRNRCMFVYPSRLAKSTRQALESDGVIVHSFKELLHFCLRLEFGLELFEREERRRQRVAEGGLPLFYESITFSQVA